MTEEFPGVSVTFKVCIIVVSALHLSVEEIGRCNRIAVKFYLQNHCVFITTGNILTFIIGGLATTFATLYAIILAVYLYYYY